MCIRGASESIGLTVEHCCPSRSVCSCVTFYTSLRLYEDVSTQLHEPRPSSGVER